MILSASIALLAAVQEVLDEVMLANDKLFVVLAVVLIIWVGFVVYTLALDRKLSRLEQSLEPDPVAEDS